MKKTLFTALLVASSTVSVLAQAKFDIKNEAEFKKCVAPEAVVQKLAGDFKFTEGPVWIPAENSVVFSDIPNNELKRWDGAAITTYRKPSNHANGNTLDLTGRLLSCEHSGRRVAIWEKGDTINPLVEKLDGKRFNSPNDIVVKSDGTVWFSDPDYGLGGKKREAEGNFVYRYDPATDKVTALVKDFDKPNGLAFSPDEKKLYVADSGQVRHIRVFDVTAEGTLTNGKIFCAIDKGNPDGIRVDAAGRVWSSSAEGIQIFTPDGALIGKILVPESPSNLCFGGASGHTLFITARSSLYSIETLEKNAR